MENSFVHLCPLSLDSFLQGCFSLSQSLNFLVDLLQQEIIKYRNMISATTKVQWIQVDDDFCDQRIQVAFLLNASLESATSHDLAQKMMEWLQ